MADTPGRISVTSASKLFSGIPSSVGNSLRVTDVNFGSGQCLNNGCRTANNFHVAITGKIDAILTITENDDIMPPASLT